MLLYVYSRTYTDWKVIMSIPSNDVVLSVGFRRAQDKLGTELVCIIETSSQQRLLYFPVDTTNEMKFVDAEKVARLVIEEMRGNEAIDNDELALWLAIHFFAGSIAEPYYDNLVAWLLDTIVDVIDDGKPRTYRWEAIRA